MIARGSATAMGAVNQVFYRKSLNHERARHLHGRYGRVAGVAVLRAFRDDMMQMGAFAVPARCGRLQLLLTKKRTETTKRAMGQLIHDAVRAAIERARIDGWWQCAVMVVHASGSPYIKTVQTAALA